MHRPVVIVIIGALSGFALPASAQDLQARVLVYGEHRGGNVAYHYQVRNDGAGEIRRFYIGCECRSPEAAGKPELQVLPARAQPARTDDFGMWYEAPGGTANQPPGWRVRVLRPHNASGHWIEWSMPSAKLGSGIGPGTSLGGFSVVLPQSDATYLNARFSVQWQQGKTASAPLALDDTTAPTLSLAAQAVTADPGMTATVHVTATARDDRDPEPRVVVESLERAEAGAGQPGYVVVYSATDASGNRATASARVEMPAARGKNAAPGPGLPPRASLP